MNKIVKRSKMIKVVKAIKMIKVVKIVKMEFLWWPRTQI